MNTPAHALLNLFVLGRKTKPKTEISAICVGGFLPDLPIFLFYFYAKVILQAPEKEIWGNLYFNSSWYQGITVFHSFPILLGLGLLCWWLKKKAGMFLFASMFGHALLDFFTHHDDAHSQFFPFSDFKFHSPVSYWDPKFFGHYFLLFEATLFFVLGAWMWRQRKDKPLRIWLGALLAMYFIGFAYAFTVWGPL